MKLSTHENIEYDADQLQAMTAKELQLQSIYRQDLFFPKREHQLQADAIQARALEAVNEFLDQLRHAGVPGVVAAVEQIVADYEAEVIA